MNTIEIIEDYIKWSNNKPFVQKENYGSLWAKPTSEQFFKYLTSDEDRLKIAKDIASWDNKKQINFADELWDTIAVVPYVWIPNRVDVKDLDDYKTFCEENPSSEDDLYFIKSRSMRSTFKKYFWSSVIISLTEFLKKDDISFVSIPKDLTNAGNNVQYSSAFFGINGKFSFTTSEALNKLALFFIYSSNFLENFSLHIALNLSISQYLLAQFLPLVKTQMQQMK